MAETIQALLSRKIKDIAGMKFGMLSVISFAGISASSGQATWNCVCDCGNNTVKEGAALRNGGVKSCGCAKDKMIGEGNTKHGDSSSQLYSIWSGMIERCSREGHRAWKDYGGRGITVCERWHDYSLFKQDMETGFVDGLQIDRRDNDGNYEPGNCRWATAKENANNRRNNRRLFFNGENLTIAQWSDKTGISHAAISKRMKLGWPVEKILTAPIRPY